MKLLVILGVALLCLSQVYGEQDVLKSLFKEQVQNLRSEKRAAAAAPDTYDCNANELVANGSEIIKNTLDIVQKTFGVAYTLYNPTSAEKKCDLPSWRCYIKEFVETKDSIDIVAKDLKEYKDKSSTLVNNVREYIEHCWDKNHQ